VPRKSSSAAALRVLKSPFARNRGATCFRFHWQSGLCVGCYAIRGRPGPAERWTFI
ncbi:hypothetical protein PF002_g33595, partial [Phytophthora fragariae]